MKKENELALARAEMRMIGWMFGVRQIDRRVFKFCTERPRDRPKKT